MTKVKAIIQMGRLYSKLTCMRTIYKLFDSDSDNNSDGRQCCCEAELCLSNGFQRHLLIFFTERSLLFYETCFTQRHLLFLRPLIVALCVCQMSLKDLLIYLLTYLRRPWHGMADNVML